MAFSVGKSMLVVASAGLMLGAATGCAEGAPDAMSPAGAAAEGKDCCKGMNECKGKGGCAVEGANDCGGKNECKAKGGCNAHCPK